MARSSALWKRFDINESILHTGENSTSVPKEETYEFKNTNLECFLEDISNNWTSQRYSLFCHLLVLVCSFYLGLH